MNKSFAVARKSYSILSIGQRGVGKTVFLAASYAELHCNHDSKSSLSLWFDCQEDEDEENINTILSYITRTGEYPPPTMKIMNFNFSLKTKNWLGTQTLCHFRWWDIPGEFCNLDNNNFRNMVFNSQGCCIFIDALALLEQANYTEKLEAIIQQIIPIGTLLYLNSSDYAFAVILTKCDLLKSNPDNEKSLKEKLQPLITHLEALKVKHETFYSYIPIVNTQEVSMLTAKGAVTPLLWLVQEIRKQENYNLMQNLFMIINDQLPKALQTKPNLARGSLQNLLESNLEPVKPGEKMQLISLLDNAKYIIGIGLAVLSLIAGISILITTVMPNYQRNVEQNQKF